MSRMSSISITEDLDCKVFCVSRRVAVISASNTRRAKNVTNIILSRFVLPARSDIAPGDIVTTSGLFVLLGRLLTVNPRVRS